MVRSDRDVHPTRDLARAWTRALGCVTEAASLRAALSLARSLGIAQRAIVFDGNAVVAGAPGGSDSAAAVRLFERARRVLEDELVAPDVYVARIAPDRPERIALRWDAPIDEAVRIARAIAASCAWALDARAGAGAPGELPDGRGTLHRLEQLVHDARRTNRSFAVVYVGVAGASPGADGAPRDAVARALRGALRANDHLGHLGGDAYLALIALETGEPEAYPAAQRLLGAASAAAPDACTSAGVAICPEDGVRPQELVEKAGAAAMAAASAAEPRPFWYRERAGRALGERTAIRARIRDGDADAVLELRLAPVFDARAETPIAVSACAAWHDGIVRAQSPSAYLAADPDRGSREALERWTVSAAAAAHRAWRAAGHRLDVQLHVASPTRPVADAIATHFDSDAMREVMVQIDADRVPPAEVDSFARRLRALGARVGVAAARASAAPFDRGGGLLDFVSVDGTHELRTLAELALASVVAPAVVVHGVGSRERARWLARHGATALSGQGLAAPLRLPELIRWASDRRSPLGQ